MLLLSCCADDAGVPRLNTAKDAPIHPTHCTPSVLGQRKGRGGEEWTRIGCQAIGANVRQTKRVSPTLAAKVRLGV